MLNWLWMLIVGLVVGAIAKLIMPGKDPGGILITMLLGVVGAFIGTIIGQQFFGYREGETAGWVLSILGAIIVLGIYRLIVGRRTAT